MYYELYIDVLFLVNFMMDYLLLLVVRRILKCRAGHRDICAGSLIGSLSACAVMALPSSLSFLKLILFHVVVNALMIRIGLKIREGESFLRAAVGLYAGGFLLGGIFTYLYQYMRTGSLFFAAAVLSYEAAQGIWSFITEIQRLNQCRCRVTLYFMGKEDTVEALIDTGNSLTDPVTGRPVCVIEKQAVETLIRERAGELRYISFHSVGTENGKLPVIQLDRMCVHREEECWIRHPVIGISRERISAGGRYQMILNPDVF